MQQLPCDATNWLTRHHDRACSHPNYSSLSDNRQDEEETSYHAFSFHGLGQTHPGLLAVNHTV